MLNRQTIYHYVLDDVYEITLGGPELVTLVRFRHGLDSRGEVVDYDDLPGLVQQSIYDKVKLHLNDHHHSHHDNSNGSQ